MNRSFEVWFSPGAHSGAGAGGSKAEDKKKGYTVNRSSPLPRFVGVWMLAAFDRSLGQKMCAFSSCGRECKTGKLRLANGPFIQVPTMMDTVSRWYRCNFEGTNVGGCLEEKHPGYPSLQ